MELPFPKHPGVHRKRLSLDLSTSGSSHFQIKTRHVFLGTRRYKGLLALLLGARTLLGFKEIHSAPPARAPPLLHGPHGAQIRARSAQIRADPRRAAHGEAPLERGGGVHFGADLCGLRKALRGPPTVERKAKATQRFEERVGGLVSGQKNVNDVRYKMI